MGTLCMIHTVPGLIPVLEPLVARDLPDWTVFNIADESLLKSTIRDGRLSEQTMRRLLNHIWSAGDAGADAILVTCSSLGPAVEASRPFCGVPLVRIDAGMALAATAGHRRIGVLATLATTLAPTTALIETTADEQGRTDCEVVSRLCDGAFDRLLAGDTEGHDRLIAEAIETLAPESDVLVLAQASMARALDRCDPALLSECPVLTSPELGVRHLARILAT